MCFTIPIKQHQAIEAKVDIVCYKIVDKLKNQNFKKDGQIVSLARNFLYHLGFEYSHADIFKHLQKDYEVEKNSKQTIGDGKIYPVYFAEGNGFHSYSSPEYNREYGEFLIIKCIIPKGAFYFGGTGIYNFGQSDRFFDFECYFSDRIIIDSVVGAVINPTPKVSKKRTSKANMKVDKNGVLKVNWF